MRYIVQYLNGKYAIYDTQKRMSLEWRGNILQAQTEAENMNHAEPGDVFCSRCLLRLLPGDIYIVNGHSLCTKCHRDERKG